MDSKLKKLTIVGALGVAVLIVFIVMATNGIFSKSTGGNPTPSLPQDSGNGAVTGQVGDDLHGFLKDNTFFDQEINEYVEEAMDGSNRLYLMVASVEKDLRIRITDAEDNLVTGIAFTVQLTDPDEAKIEYKDLDKDGVIYAGMLKPGNYEIQLMPVDGYKLPATATSVRVKEKVEYVPVDDLYLEIVSEDDIDSQSEDTAVWDAEYSADGSEERTLMLGGTKQKVGVDVSGKTGEVDWEKLAEAGAEFAIIRGGYRGASSGKLVADAAFETNIKGALAAGLEVGVYYYTQAINEEEAVEEASALLSMIKGYDVAMPVYIMTGSSAGGRGDNLDIETRSLVCEAFCRTVTNAGYSAGVYASGEWIADRLNMSGLNKYEIWLAQYLGIPTYEDYYTMWQYTSKGILDGIDGDAHLNVYYYN